MRIYHDWHAIDVADRGASAAMGNFDGVHLGHRHVIERAAAAGRPAIVTFEPHPRAWFAPDAPPFRLMNAEARANRLEKLGVRTLFELPFDAGLAALTPEAFVADVLHDGLGLANVVVGADFRFGKGRAGDAQALARLAAGHGIATDIADIVAAGDARISSTAIRAALSEGDMGAAAAMLGHWHRIEGPVIHGEKRGRAMGYPTANMDVTGLHPLRAGVYAVWADVLGGPHRGRWKGAANFGVRPMFGENLPNLETHLLDFDGDLYGAHLSVAFVRYLRPEVRFEGVERLVAQMDADCALARAVLEDA